MFHLQQSRHHIFSMVQQFLSRLQRIGSRWFLLLDQEKASFSFNLFTTYPQYNMHKLGKSNKFWILSISIPSGSSSTIIIFSKRLSSSSMKTWFSLKIELERLSICEKSFLHSILFHMIYLFAFSAQLKSLQTKFWHVLSINQIITKKLVN